jgi:hypothetical protein
MFNKKALDIADRICRMEPSKADELVKDKPKLKAYLEMNRKVRKQYPQNSQSLPPKTPTSKGPGSQVQAMARPKRLKE